MNIWNRFRIIKIFIQLVMNPKKTELIFQGVQIASQDTNQEPLRNLENVVFSHSEFKTMYDTHYMPEAPSLEKLSLLPKNSFGHCLYLHMKSNQLDFNTFPRSDSRRPIDYLSTRIYQDHDLWHVILDNGVNVEDELAIQAYGIAQFPSPIAVLLVAGGLIHLLIKNPQRALNAFVKINHTYFLGKNSKFLLGVRLHELFAQPINEVRDFWGVTAKGPN